VNIGYTFFLFPLLSILYPGRVPFTLHNLFSFLIVDTLWGVILSFVIYIVAKISKIRITTAITYSLIILWIIYWSIVIVINSLDLNIADRLVTIFIDACALFITWVSLQILVKYYDKEHI